MEDFTIFFFSGAVLLRSPSFTYTTSSVHTFQTSPVTVMPSHRSRCYVWRCVFLPMAVFLYNVGDAEHLSKATVCRAIRRVCLALKRLLQTFVVFPGHKPVRAIKEEFHRIAGEGCRDLLNSFNIRLYYDIVLPPQTWISNFL